MNKRMGLTLFAVSFAVFASAYVPAMAGGDSKTVFYVEDGVSTAYTTTAETVQDFLSERGISLTPRDTLNVRYTDLLESGSKMELARGFYVNLSVDGDIERFKVSQGTSVGKCVRLFEEERNKKYFYAGSASAMLSPGDSLALIAYREETSTEESEIPFETITEETADLARGSESVVQEGQPGKKVARYKQVILGDEEQEKELISEEIEVEPQPRILKVGTAEPTPAPTPVPKRGSVAAIAENYSNLGTLAADVSELNYSKVITMTSTAYSAGPASTGKSPGSSGYGVTASGMRVRPGVVSVDPRVIPLGTYLYVEGYGYSIAADTGGAIKGNKIDVYLETESACRKWGRKSVQVYVLD